MDLIDRREAYPDGVLYASKECHYSIFKAARMYRMELVKLESLVSGAMDCSDLKAQLQQRKHRAAIIVVNIGIVNCLYFAWMMVFVLFSYHILWYIYAYAK